MRVKYKNDIYNLIKKLDFSPEKFDLVVDNSVDLQYPTTILEYKNSPFYFFIRTSNENYNLFDFQYVQYGPAFPLSDFYPAKDFTTFDVVENYIKSWLNYHVQQYIEDKDEPDLWQKLKENDKSLNIDEIDFDNKDNFSIIEQQQVKMALEELKLLINNEFKTTNEQQKLVEARLDYLIDATLRLNKFDWKSLVISTLISISVSLTLDTTKGKILFDLFKQVFSLIPTLK